MTSKNIENVVVYGRGKNIHEAIKNLSLDGPQRMKGQVIVELGNCSESQRVAIASLKQAYPIFPQDAPNPIRGESLENYAKRVCPEEIINNQFSLDSPLYL